jgi:hypothetical protein
MPVKQNIAQTPGSLLPGSFRPESFTDHLEGLSKSELVAIIADAREFGMSVINAEYEQFEEAMDNASNRA